MGTTIWGKLLGAVALVAAVGCGGDNHACTAGASAPCACVDGRSGAQLCTAAGSFGACVCAGGTDAGGVTDVATSVDVGSPVDTGAPDDVTAVVDVGTPMDAGTPVDVIVAIDVGVPVDTGTAVDSGPPPADVQASDAPDASADAGMVNCTPGEATCLSTSTRSVCNSTGTGTVTTACVVGAHATPLCSAGRCLLTCAAGYADCDGDVTNGCELTGMCEAVHRDLGGPLGIGPSDQCIPANDDGEWAGSTTASEPAFPIDLRTNFPAGLSLYGTIYRDLYLFTNGALTVQGAYVSYTDALPSANTPAFLPWLADIDTRSGGGQPVHNMICFSNVTGQFTATWLDVSAHSGTSSMMNTFQVALIDRSEVHPGDLDVEYRYGRCDWAANGSRNARAAFDSGNHHDWFGLPGSGTATVINLCTTSNVGRPGVWRMEVRLGVARLL